MVRYFSTSSFEKMRVTPDSWLVLDEGVYGKREAARQGAPPGETRQAQRTG
jgi:hypothetical protein